MNKIIENFLFVDIEGQKLTKEDKVILEHPYVVGVILFSRNYSDNENGIEQITKLIKDIKSIKNKNLKIAVDHEGGDVQRFKANFTLLPKAVDIEEIHKHNKEKGLKLAYSVGKTAGYELFNIGVDINFAPSIDLRGIDNKIVKTRSFGDDKYIVTRLAREYIKGLSESGVMAVVKHFPGHGFVEHDSHFDLPIDNRELDIIEQNDLFIYKEIFKIIPSNQYAVMSAHVLYPKIDNEYPASLSTIWMNDILKGKMNFEGHIFSDDLNMLALNNFGTPVEKVKLSLEAGCDYILYCNNREAVLDILDNL
tara:strand:- start:20035 stop:20958 length:924 start_codon:yes stop_codon:yes gene_type:complete